MKKKWIFTGIFVFLILAVSVSIGNLFRLNYEVQKNWTHLEAEYQWRADLIPNLAVLITTDDDKILNAVSEMVASRINAVQQQRNTEARAPGRIAAVKSRLTNLFILGKGHFIQNQQRFSKYTGAQQKISDLNDMFLNSIVLYSEENNIAFDQIVTYLRDSTDDIENAMHKYNTSAIRFNRAAGIFPVNLYAGLVGFNKVVEID